MNLGNVRGQSRPQCTGNLQTSPSKGISYRTLVLKNLDWSSVYGVRASVYGSLVILVSVQVLLVLLRLQSLTTLDSLNRFLEVRLFWKNDNDKESIVLEKFKLFGSVDKLRSNLRILGVFYVVTLCLYDLKDIQPKMLKRVLTGNGVFTLSLCVKQTGSSSLQK